jgi:protein tyrosine/serine phosphatase
MVKITPKPLRRPHEAPDLATPQGRARAWRELYLGDHHFLRAGFSNLHRISPEMWRSNQPSPAQIRAYAHKLGIRTIFNLRGPSSRGFYLLEKEACAAAGIALVDFQLFSREPPSREKIFEAKELFAQAAYPALMHCKSGADRAGIGAVLYRHLREGVAFEEAAAQLSARYLHIRQGRTGVLDAFCDAYTRFNDGRARRAWKPFLDWVAEDYDPGAVKAAFLARLGRGLHLDVLLRRE